MSLTCKETAICRGCDSLRERMTFLRRAMRRAAERDDGEKP